MMTIQINFMDCSDTSRPEYSKTMIVKADNLIKVQKVLDKAKYYKDLYIQNDQIMTDEIPDYLQDCTYDLDFFIKSLRENFQGQIQEVDYELSYSY